MSGPAPLADLLARHAQAGRVAGLWRRPARRAPPEAVTEAALTEAGLAGDHARAGKRALTLIQAEHLPALAGILGQEAVSPALLRRNLLVAGLNLAALRGRQLRIGPEAVVEITRPCAPCSRMEEALGPGGYSAMRGHGGWCARVLRPGPVSVGAPVTPL